MLNYRCVNNIFGYCKTPSAITHNQIISNHGQITYEAGSTCPNDWHTCLHFETQTQHFPVAVK